MGNKICFLKLKLKTWADLQLEIVRNVGKRIQTLIKSAHNPNDQINVKKIQFLFFLFFFY